MTLASTVANAVIPIVGLQGCRGNGEVMRGLKYDVRLPGSVNLKVKKGKRDGGCDRAVGLWWLYSPCRDKYPACSIAKPSVKAIRGSLFSPNCFINYRAINTVIFQSKMFDPYWMCTLPISDDVAYLVVLRVVCPHRFLQILLLPMSFCFQTEDWCEFTRPSQIVFSPVAKNWKKKKKSCHLVRPIASSKWEYV